MFKLTGARKAGCGRRRSRGAAALEVVIIVPVMVLMLFGFTEVYLYLRAVSMVEHAAFALANSLGQMPNVTDASGTASANNLGSLWADANWLASPDTLAANGNVIVTSICDKSPSENNCGWNVVGTPSLSSGTPAICWQAEASSIADMASKITPSNVLPSTWPFYQGDAALVIEVFYRYTPFPLLSTFWPGAPGSTVLYRRVYTRQRAMNWTSMPLMNTNGTAVTAGSGLSAGCSGSTVIVGS
ncbi:TadE/TadG family type IV pilus assembly protein [Paraburkholderia lycopersici]|uniref:TadE-like protein n=1 Tax=Paraburkholderia lycopersici TaxID=416944 RepID=A0A1G6W0S5_9BURK|nr:TadE family protein [Paraburkholderia lycopersici]SDD59384.1 TadE-like protein [Paraburkholderia lycopersici]